MALTISGIKTQWTVSKKKRQNFVFLKPYKKFIAPCHRYGSPSYFQSISSH